MNKTLIFFCISCALIAFTIVTICTGPIISGNFDWKNGNCQHYADHHKYIDSKTFPSNVLKDDYLKYLKKGQHLCERRKAMHGLEYASFISDLFFGVLCGLLSLLHYFGVGKVFEKVTGIIGLACGVIGFILTLIYIIYSGYIFTNDSPGKDYDLSTSSVPSTSPISPYDSSDSIIKLNKDRAFAEWKSNKFECLYYEKDNEDSFYVKYNDLGKKQYNYHKDYEFADDDSEYENCKLDKLNGQLGPYISLSDIVSYCKNPDITNNKNSNNNKECKYIYYDNRGSSGFSNKYRYDKWVTSIIFGCFIIVLNLGLAFFGFLLFKQTDGQSGPVTFQ